MKNTLFPGVTILAAAWIAASWSDARPAFGADLMPGGGKPRVIHNEDSDGATRNRMPLVGKVKPTTEKWFDDLFTTTPVDLVIYCSALGDLVWLHNVPSGERVYTRPGLSTKPAGGTPTEDQIREKAALEELWAQKTDVLAIAVERAHAHGKIALAEMRMSDYHHGGVLPEAYLCPKSVLDHPEWRIGPDVGLLDYSHQEVRGLYLTVLRDIARNYQVDGIVLNWTRFGRHFAGEQRPKAPILTAWLRELRKMLDDVSARQHRRRMLLAHITLATLDESLDHGCDVAQWMKRGLADIVMPMDFLHADFNQPVEQFAAAARGTGCLVYANVHESLGRPGYSITLAKHRALAANHYAWGADGVGTFNMYVAPMAWLRQALPILADAKRVDKGPRHYQFVRPTSASRPVEFGDLDRRYVFTFRMADGRRGEKLRGLLRAFVEGPASPSGDEFAVDVNGVPVAREQMRISFSAASAPAPFAGAGYSEGRDVYPAGLRIEFPLEQCPTFRGLNELGVRWTKRDNANKAPRRLQVVEVLVAS